jgi:hypothetical protein
LLLLMASRIITSQRPFKISLKILNLYIFLRMAVSKTWKMQSWALAHFFMVRYPLHTQFFPLDR